ncbi:hypothetical protein DL98DRAFT_529130 [Cadophora sp. DSE1049]|nr:hypothetical protein DL98DRAFT_529130 [Cadophora sp. DSE1049]
MEHQHWRPPKPEATFTVSFYHYSGLKPRLVRRDHHGAYVLIPCGSNTKTNAKKSDNSLQVSINPGSTLNEVLVKIQNRIPFVDRDSYSTEHWQIEHVCWRCGFIVKPHFWKRWRAWSDESCQRVLRKIVERGMKDTIRIACLHNELEDSRSSW